MLHNKVISTIAVVVLPLAAILLAMACAPQDSSHATGQEAKMSRKSFSEEELKRRLTPLQYHVARESGTEPPFDNEFWNEHREGLFVDIVNGKPLFSSKDKFDSGTGWPSFTRPLDSASVVEKKDTGKQAEGKHKADDDAEWPPFTAACRGSQNQRQNR